MLVRLILGLLQEANEETLKETSSSSPFQGSKEKMVITTSLSLEKKNGKDDDIKIKKSWQSILSELSLINPKNKDSNGSIKKLIKSAIASALTSGTLSTTALTSTSSALTSTSRSSTSTLGWLHQHTSVISELSVALGLYHFEQPIFAYKLALQVLDIYGGYSLCVSKHHNGDLLYHDMQSNNNLDENNTTGKDKGNDLLSTLSIEMRALCSANDKKRKVLNNSSSSSSSTGPPPAPTPATFKHLIILPTQTEMDTAKKSVNKNMSLFKYYQEKCPNITSIRRDFGAPYGIFVGFVISYLKPYYTVIYEDGDSEELSVDKVIQLRQCYAENVKLEDNKRNRDKFGSKIDNNNNTSRKLIKIKLATDEDVKLDENEEEENDVKRNRKRRNRGGEENASPQTMKKVIIGGAIAELPVLPQGIEYLE